MSLDGVDRRRAELVLGPRRRKTQRKPPSLRQRLKNWNNIPDFLRDNEYIRTGYRANWSLKEALISLFQIHNETMNVWTHMAGFVLFVVVTIWLAVSPPTPLVHPRASLEHQWSSVQDKMRYFRDHIGDTVHLFPDSFEQSIHTLHDSLHESLAAVQLQVQENLEHARDSLQETVEPFSKKLHNSFSTLSEALQHFQGSLESMAGSVNIKVSTVRSNLEKSFNAVQENLHNVQHDLSGNLNAACTHLKKSLTSFQENLMKLQSILHDTHSRHSYSSNVSSLSHCPITDSTHLSEGWKSVGYAAVVRWPVFVYLYGAMFCLLVSSVSHLFACCSKHLATYMWKFDYTGIAVLIVTSFYPAVYYGFLCQPLWTVFYLGSTTVLGAGTIMASFVNYMQTPKFRPLRAGMFVGLGLFGVIPWAHQLVINFHEPSVRTAVVYELIMAAFYLGGAAFFVSRVPERFNPGAFDILLHSHQIFHIFVVIAAWVHFQAVWHLMEWRESTNGCPLDSLLSF